MVSGIMVDVGGSQRSQHFDGTTSTIMDRFPSTWGRGNRTAEIATAVSWYSPSGRSRSNGNISSTRVSKKMSDGSQQQHLLLHCHHLTNLKTRMWIMRAGIQSEICMIQQVPRSFCPLQQLKQIYYLLLIGKRRYDQAYKNDYNLNYNRNRERTISNSSNDMCCNIIEWYFKNYRWWMELELDSTWQNVQVIVLQISILQQTVRQQWNKLSMVVQVKVATSMMAGTSVSIINMLHLFFLLVHFIFWNCAFLEMLFYTCFAPFCSIRNNRVIKTSCCCTFWKIDMRSTT